MKVLQDRAGYRHWDQTQIRWSDTDLVGHVNNLAFGAYCELGRAHFMSRIANQTALDGPLFVLARLTIDFVQEMHWPGMVDIGTGVISLGNTSMTLGNGIFLDGTCRGTGQATMVYIDRTVRKPTPIPEELRARFQEFALEPQQP